MGYALVVFLAFLNGGEQHLGVSFPSVEECMAEQPNAVEQITAYNVSPEPNKIVSYAAVCVPMGKAPQGKSI